MLRSYFFCVRIDCGRSYFTKKYGFGVILPG